MRKSQITKKKRFSLLLHQEAQLMADNMSMTRKDTCTFDYQASDTTTPSVKNTTQPVLLNFRNFCREQSVSTRISPNGNRFRLRSALRQRDQLWLLRILHWTEPLRHSRWQNAKSRQRRKQPTVSSPSATLLQPCEPVCTYACSGCVRSLRELFGRREDRFEDARWQIAEMTAAGLTTRLAVR